MLRKLTAIIIDDEPIAIKGLQKFINELNFMEVVGVCENAMDALSILNTTPVDVMFMDINMPKITGIDFLKTLKNKPLTIITSAYPDYALEGYELDVLDYLVKPVSFERFLKSCNKAYDYWQRVQQNNQIVTSNKADFIFIKTEHKIEKIAFNDILFIESLHNYIAIFMETGRCISYLTLKSIEEKLPLDQFIKVHKSFIVSTLKVESIDGDFLFIKGNQIPISREHKTEIVKKILGNNFLKR